MEMANICPVHKKGKKTKVENYRPISLMPILAKVQEICVLNRLLRTFHLACLTRNMASLMVSHAPPSCCKSSMNLAGLLIVDWKLNFDSVCHAKLLSKLRTFGIKGPLLEWFTSYLSGRQQCVVVNSCFSFWGVVKSGVPQGSILRPILFLMFANDMPDVLKSSSLAMYADDSKCFKTIKTTSDICDLKADLNLLCDWSSSNELYFQPTTCHNKPQENQLTSSIQTKQYRTETCFERKRPWTYSH